MPSAGTPTEDTMTGSQPFSAPRSGDGRSYGSRPSVTILVPFLDERDNLPVLVPQLRTLMDSLTDAGLARAVDAVLVDDGSTDGSADVARAAVRGDARFRVLSLRRHYGKSAAIAAGRDHSTGEVVVTMDADLQDSPDAVPLLLAELAAGYDLVTAWRRNRKDPAHRRAFAAVFNRITTRVAGVPIHDVNSGLKAYRRAVLDALHLSPGMHRFTAIVAHGYGFRIGEVIVDHRPRHAGRTKYGPWRYVEATLGFLTALYVRRLDRSPMTSLGVTGVVLLLLALLGGAALAWAGAATAAGLCAAALGVVGVQFVVAALAAELAMQRHAAGRAPAIYLLREEPDQGPRRPTQVPSPAVRDGR